MSKYLAGIERMRQMRKEMMDESLKPEGNTIFDKLKNAKTIPELNSLRMESLKEMQSKNDEIYFLEVQNAFIKAKNRIKRNRLPEQKK